MIRSQVTEEGTYALRLVAKTPFVTTNDYYVEFSVTFEQAKYDIEDRETICAVNEDLNGGSSFASME